MSALKDPVVLQVVVAGETADRLRGAATDVGQKVSNFCRMLLMEALQQREAPKSSHALDNSPIERRGAG